MNALTKISLYCVYKESDISSRCFFSWCAYLLLTCFFFSSFHQNSGDSFSPVYAHWQIVSSQNPKFTVDAQPVYRDDETHSYFIDWRVQNYCLPPFFFEIYVYIAYLGVVLLNAQALNAMYYWIMMWIWDRLRSINLQHQLRQDVCCP